MMWILLILIINLVRTDDFYIMGLNTTFGEVPHSDRTCNWANSCSKTICDLLKNDTLCVSYAVFTPYNFKCTQIDSYASTNMIVIGINNSKQLTSPVVCSSMGSCLYIGCKMFQSPSLIGVMFTGECL